MPNTQLKFFLSRMNNYFIMKVTALKTLKENPMAI